MLCCVMLCYVMSCSCEVAERRRSTWSRFRIYIACCRSEVATTSIILIRAKQRVRKWPPGNSARNTLRGGENIQNNQACASVLTKYLNVGKPPEQSKGLGGNIDQNSTSAWYQKGSPGRSGWFEQKGGKKRDTKRGKKQRVKKGGGERQWGVTKMCIAINCTHLGPPRFEATIAGVL